MPGKTADTPRTTNNSGETSAVQSKQTSARPAALPRSALPYYVAAVFALATMAWYVFIFVPSKVEYFVGLKLRALAVAANQVETRAENLAIAFRTAPHIPEDDDPRNGATAKYLRALVPDIKLLREDDPKVAGLMLRRRPAPNATAPAQGAKQVETRPFVGSVPWQQLMAQAASVSASEFDDLIVAVPAGDVVWQREQTTPRVGNLAQVLDTTAAESGWFSLRWTPKPQVPNKDAKALATAVVVKPVELGGEATLLLVQTIALPADSVDIEGMPGLPVDSKEAAAQGAMPRGPHRLHVAATVPLAMLRAQAMNIPIVWVVALSLPVILLFLALPAVKLATLTPRERFGFVDVVALLIATVAIAGLGAAMPLTQTAVNDNGDDMLANFSAALQARLVEDVKKIQAVAAVVGARTGEIEDRLQHCIVKVDRFPLQRCNFWAALHELSKNPPDKTSQVQAPPAGQIDLDIVAWLDEAGGQLDKWTTKAQLTGPTPHDRFQHYRDLTQDRLWMLKSPPGNDGPSKIRFTIEPLRAPTTADLASIVGFRLDELQTSAEPRKEDGESDRSQAKYLVLNVRPGSLFDAVVPPGFGFAVIAPDGRVLFHSQENLSLGENFFEEVGEPARVHARAQSVRKATWTGDYHGRPHRIHIERPVAIDGCPWRVVTFRELTPVYGGAFTHQSGTFRLGLINLCCLFFFAVGVWLWARFKRRDVRDLLNVRPITQPFWIWVQVGLTTLACFVVVLTYVSWMGRALNVFYGFFVVLPFAALWTASRARKSTGPPSGPNAGLVWTELALMVALVAALPAIGFSRIAERVQVSRGNERLLEDTQRTIASRNVRMHARVTSPAYPSRDSQPAVPPTGAARLTQPPQTDAAGLQRAAPSTPQTAASKTSSFDVRTHLKATGFARATDVAAYSYLGFVPIEVVPPAINGINPLEGQTLVRFLLDWNPLPSRDQAGEPAMVVDGDTFTLNSPVRDLPALAVRDTSLALPPFLATATGFSAPPAKGVAGVLLLVAAIAGLYWARQRLLAHTHRDAPGLVEILACLPTVGRNGVMMIGAPRTGKDSVLLETLKARKTEVGLRIRLLGKEAQPDRVERQLQDLAQPRGWLWKGLGGESRPRGPLWINVSNLETHLVDRKHRSLALQLLERLLDTEVSDVPRVVVVTTNVDPVAHFEEIFEEERAGIYEDAVPEVELGRLAVLLSRFHRCYVPFCENASDADPWWDYRPERWPDVLDWETRSVALARVNRELRAQWGANERVSFDDLSRAITARAAALYQLLWTSCTRREKLVLVQLAQEGFVTPQSAAVVAALMAKGLIVLRPGPAIFNYTFRAFLRDIERTHVLREWERGEGHGLWVVAGRLIGSSVLAGGLFFLLTQGYSVEGLLPVLSGTGLFGVPVVRNIVARLTRKEGSAQAA